MNISAIAIASSLGIDFGSAKPSSRPPMPDYQISDAQDVLTSFAQDNSDLMGEAPYIRPSRGIPVAGPKDTIQ